MFFVSRRQPSLSEGGRRWREEVHSSVKLMAVIHCYVDPCVATKPGRCTVGVSPTTTRLQVGGGEGEGNLYFTMRPRFWSYLCFYYKMRLNIMAKQTDTTRAVAHKPCALYIYTRYVHHELLINIHTWRA